MKLSTIKCFAVIVFLMSAVNISCKKNDPTPTPPASDVDLKKGLLLYLPFSGNTLDSSGNNNTVQSTGSGSVLTYDEHGYLNSAFDGKGARLLVTNNGSIQFDTAFTVSVNFMIRSMSYQVYLSMVDNVTGDGPSFNLGNTIQGSPNFDFSVLDKTASCTEFGTLSESNNLLTQFIPQPESWYNAICIYHRGTVEVFINGKLISTQESSGTGALLCPNSKFVIGGWWDSDALTFNGKLDNVRMYNRVINSDEIAALAKGF